MAIFDSCYKNLWVEPVIDADGTTMICCRNSYKLFSNTLGFDNIVGDLPSPKGNGFFLQRRKFLKLPQNLAA